MIHSLEDKTKKELIEICKIQVEEYQQLTKQFNYVVDLYESRIENMEKRIAELEAEIIEDFNLILKLTDSDCIKDKRIAELEESLRTVAQTRCVSYEDLAIRDLEQQAKGIKDAIEYLGWEDIYTATCPNKKVSNELRFVAGQLSKEAQALKERGHE